MKDRKKDAFKTGKFDTLPLPIDPSPSSTNTPSAREVPIHEDRGSSRPSRPSRIPMTPGSGSPTRISTIPLVAPSSDSTWTVEADGDRDTEPQIAIAHSADRELRAIVTVITGFNAGQVFTLDGVSHLVGRGPDAEVWIEDNGVSRSHARILRKTDGTFAVEDLRSTNGTFVNGQRVQRADLTQLDRIQLGPNLLLRFAVVDGAEEELQRRLYESSTRDSLTRVYNRKYLMERLLAEVAHSKRHRVKLSVLMLDIDNFKSLNDTFGHLAGDLVLRMVAAQMTRLIRVEDLLARYGGEEFVILARSTGRTEAVRLAERIRSSICSTPIDVGEGESVTISVSIGVATLAEAGDDASANDLVLLADKRLYRAKSDGRNRVRSED